MKTDVLIVGSGVAGLYCALNLPKDKKVTVITKSDVESSDSYLAQGGICVLKDRSDYASFFKDTLKAGHYENDRESVSIMINSSMEVIQELVGCGVDFKRKEDGSFEFTKEGAHSHKRILFHEDITGKEITSHLLETAKAKKNITLIENFTMVDLICYNNHCNGIVGHEVQDRFGIQTFG